MPSVNSYTRLAISIGLISVSVIWLAAGLKFIPDARTPQIEGRCNFADSLAVSASALVEAKRFRELELVLQEIHRRNRQILSIGLRDSEAKLTFQSGDHQRLWQADAPSSPADQMTMTVFQDRNPRGTLELKFAPMRQSSWVGFLTFPLPLILFCGAMLIVLNWSYLKQTFRHLNPARILPDRVRSAFDTLTDGLLLIDNDYQIVMANQAFLRVVNQFGKDLQGRSIQEFAWRFEDEPGRPSDSSPWERCVKSQQTQRGDLVTLQGNGQAHVRYAVGATPIVGSEGNCRGAIVSFHDVTAFETKKEQMGKMLIELSASRDEVQRKNRDLQVLASTDPLTSCLNRRSFFERFSGLWDKSPRVLSAIMVDIDHFKHINDKYGHSTGDVVLQETGQLLLDFVGNNGMVGRYGGEEFAIVMDAMDLNSAFSFAEKLRLEFSKRQPAGLDATMSIGVSSREQGAMDCQHLLEQADQGLYVAKREGRNRVICWDRLHASQILADDQDKSGSNSNDDVPNDISASIQYPVVTAMLSALAFRDRETAVHSTRVARLCLQVGGRLMNKDELYELEIAALLHDVGKIGVPDAILKKTGALSAEEWQVMRWSDEIGIEIIRAAFASEKITAFIRCHYLRSDGPPSNSLIDLEHVIPLGARVLTVCDAFDAMINQRPYRNAMSRDDALTELYRGSDEQFDPLIVRTLERVLADESNAKSSQGDPVPSEPPAPAPLEMGAFVEHLSSAIAAGDVFQLREIARQVEAAATQHNIDWVVKAAHRLEMSIENNEASLSQLVGLANEIIDLCRSSRTQIVENPIVIRADQRSSNEYPRSADDCRL